MQIVKQSIFFIIKRRLRLLNDHQALQIYDSFKCNDIT